MMRLLLIPAALLATQVQAHEGHGLAGSHWHAGDASLILALAAVAVAIYLIRRK